MKLLLLSLLLLIVVGCSYKTAYIQSSSQKYPKTIPNDIKVYAAETIAGDYEVMGVVAVDLASGDIGAKKALVRKAARYGADAIINVRLTRINSFAQRSSMDGVMIKYKDTAPVATNQ